MNEMTKYGPVINVEVLREDEQGRPIIRCPNLGHDEELIADERGEYQCPEARALSEYIAAYFRNNREAFDRALLGRNPA